MDKKESLYEVTEWHQNQIPQSTNHNETILMTSDQLTSYLRAHGLDGEITYQGFNIYIETTHGSKLIFWNTDKK